VEIKKSELMSFLGKVSNLKALVIGDIILDRYIWGETERISPEAPVPIVNEVARECRLGGAANVVRNLRSLGVSVNVCGFIGDDPEAHEVLDLLRLEKVDTYGLLVDRLRPTSVKTRIVSRNQQILRIDREDKKQHTAAMCDGFAALVEAFIERVDFIIVSDYAKGVVSRKLIDKLEILQQNGVLGLAGKPLFFDPHPSHYNIYRSLSVAKPNRKEAELAVQMPICSKDDAFVAAKQLIKMWNSEMIIISLGEDGMLVLKRGDNEPLLIDTVAKEVFDVSGAGDTVTSVFAAMMAAGADMKTAGFLSNMAAGIVVSEIGTSPIRYEKLIAMIEKECTN